MAHSIKALKFYFFKKCVSDKNSLFAGLNFNPYESPRVAMAGPTSGIVTPSAATSLYAGARRDLSLNNSDGSIPPAEW